MCIFADSVKKDSITSRATTEAEEDEDEGGVIQAALNPSGGTNADEEDDEAAAPPFRFTSPGGDEAGCCKVATAADVDEDDAELGRCAPPVANLNPPTFEGLEE